MNGMSDLEVPFFPRGFLFSERPVEPPPTFVHGPLLENFFVHPWTNVETAGDRGFFVIVIGHCVPTGPEQGVPPAAALLSALWDSEGAFFRALDDYGGRHAILFGRPGNIGVVNDASGMRSVFYATAGGVIASHALLVEQALGGEIHRDDLPFRYGYPGNRTPYARTRILTPNTYYWMTANLIRRFWPIVAPAPRTVEEAATELLDASTNAFRSMAQGREVELTLTAGLDSRTVLAIALHADVQFRTYTYGNTSPTKIDRLAAAELATRAGVEHVVVSNRVNDQSLKERIDEVNYNVHHARWVGCLRQYFQDPHSVAVLGNGLEIGRSNYTPQRRAGAAAPVDALKMAQLHHRKVGRQVNELIDDFGVERFWDISIEAFQGFIDDTGYVTGLLDPFDQFYWEHRMGTWQGVAMGERDFYAASFIPYNSRRIFDSLLGAPFESRRDDEAVLRMIEMVDPGLLELPVNPLRWPTKKLSPVSGR